MKILPFLNINTPQHKTKQANYNGSNMSSPLHYAYNLPCDTVSFGEANGEDDFDIKDVFLNTEEIYLSIATDCPEDASKSLDELGLGEWNPCFVYKDEKNNAKSLMSLVIEKITDTDCSSQNWSHLSDIAGEISAHPDFEPIDEDLERDYLSEAISKGSPEIAMLILKSGKLEKFLTTEKCDEYAKLAKSFGMNGIVKEMSDLAFCCSMSGYEKESSVRKNNESSETLKDRSSLSDTDLNKLASLGEINASLSPYMVIRGENDPSSFDDVGGMFKAKKDIDEFILKPWNKDFRDKIKENRLNRPSGFLLSGPPGCGKTYILKALAAETGYDLYEINLANIGASEGYKTQNDLKKVFKNLEEKYKLTGEPSILLLDELDSIAMDRRKCHTDWKKDDINALLMVLNNSAQRGIIVVGATNNPDDLDEAVIRPGRLDKHLKVELPQQEERQDIVEKILIDRPIAQDLIMDSPILAKKLNGKTPAEISSILHNACLNAIYSYKVVATMEDFDKMLAAQNESKVDKGRKPIRGFSS